MLCTTKKPAEFQTPRRNPSKGPILPCGAEPLRRTGGAPHLVRGSGLALLTPARSAMTHHERQPGTGATEATRGEEVPSRSLARLQPRGRAQGNKQPSAAAAAAAGKGAGSGTCRWW